MYETNQNRFSWIVTYKSNSVAGGMALWLRVLSALGEDPGLSSSTHVVAKNHL